MSENTQPSGDVKLADEIKKMEYEPLLQVEKKLIAWSLVMGIGLLAILVWVSNTFFQSV